MSEEKWVEYGAEQGDISEEYDNHMLFHTEQLADWADMLTVAIRDCTCSPAHPMFMR